MKTILNKIYISNSNRIFCYFQMASSDVDMVQRVVQLHREKTTFKTRFFYFSTKLTCFFVYRAKLLAEDVERIVPVILNRSK